MSTATTSAERYPATLAESLAVFQASPPKIGKGNTADVKNEQGKKLYSYDYANLADVNEEVLPRLGAVGLAFISRPTMLDGQFVLAYSLVHVSGEREDGVYPLPTNGKPQAIGGAITYARRYCLCAVTGVAAAGDDDDAGAAQAEHRQSAGDVFENSRPARPRPVSQKPTRPAAVAAVPNPAVEVDVEAQELANEAHNAQVIADLRGTWTRAKESVGLNAIISDPATGEKMPLVQLIDARRREFEDADAALKEFHAAAEAAHMPIGQMEELVKLTTGADFEKATAAQLRQATAALTRGEVALDGNSRGSTGGHSRLRVAAFRAD